MSEPIPPDRFEPDVPVAPRTKADERPSLGPEFLRQLWTANTVTVTVLAIFVALVIGGVMIIISTPEVAFSV